MAVILPDSVTGWERLDAYRSRGGYRGLARALELDPETVADWLLQADLRGRGGAGYPTGKKWQAVIRHAEAERYLVVNGAEGEPGAFKDRRLMATAPHAVVEGLLIAAWAIRATAVLVYVNSDFQDAARALGGALDEAVEAGWAGPGGRVKAPVKLLLEPHVYIAGEETALLNVLMGNPAQPWHKPPYPTEKGLWGKPTVVNNVETLAAAAVILREGPEWFRARRPMLFSVSGDVRLPGVYEAPLGTRLADLLERAGGPPPGERFQAVLPGGYSMPPLFADQLGVPLDYDALAALGTGLGASIIAVATNRTLGQVAADILEFFARETCGKCPVCVKGTRVLADQLGPARGGPLAEAAQRELLATAVKYRHKGICSFLDTAAHLAESLAPQVGPAAGVRLDA
ncbi:MAG: SLBB domain-containing protein [Actinomycetia bacterium]|nr:SLBB domain-containing protein [Actinomycetes bacterium]